RPLRNEGHDQSRQGIAQLFAGAAGLADRRPHHHLRNRRVAGSGSHPVEIAGCFLNTTKSLMGHTGQCLGHCGTEHSSMNETAYETIKVRFQEAICFLEINRPAAKNTINVQLVAELGEVLSLCEESATVVVLSGLPEVFCSGADFEAIARREPVPPSGEQKGDGKPDPV